MNAQDKIKDYLKGVQDCEEGRLHAAGKSKDYNKGYAAQKRIEKNLAHKRELRK